MKLLSQLLHYADNYGDHIAIKNPHSTPEYITYAQLFRWSRKLGEAIIETDNTRNPIIVYGHKNPLSIVCFLACAFSGRAYCPVDVSLPDERLLSIIKQTDSALIFATEELPISFQGIVFTKDQIEGICYTDSMPENISLSLPKTCVYGDDTFYIIFTSGSTGSPKGVEISADALDNFLGWSSLLIKDKKTTSDETFMNQAPFSFDLSVMDVYTSLYCGCTLCLMEKKIQNSLSNISAFIRDNNISVFVSTPSFVNTCLVDRCFEHNNLPNLKYFLFCGETLQAKTARKLIERFPESIIYNTYGPTESTVAVSAVKIDYSIVDEYDPLPLGYIKPGTGCIIDYSYSEAVDQNLEFGEVLLTGDTLAKGYFNRPDLTSTSFVNIEKDNQSIRAYRTGDLGYLKDDMLFYIGRKDSQIKMNGYRIELGDIENSLLKNPAIREAVVLPRIKDGVVKSLAAIVTVFGGSSCDEDGVKETLKRTLPAYMVPKRIYFIDQMPLSANRKIDRKVLLNILETGELT